MNKPKFETPDMTQKNIDKISQLFPNCITETKDENGNLKKAVNFELLQQMLSDEIADKDEAYEFTWVGKNASIVEANKPIRKTLRPCKEESVNWATTENLYIEGDNLEVLKLLQESYLGKVKMIYIDPPYNTGNDFIYRDDFTLSSEEYAEEAGLFDDEGNRMLKNTDTNGRFHSDWCSMIYSRLLLARNLLTDDGVIFISIDDNEVDNLKKICGEVFGESNFVAQLIWERAFSPKNDARFISNSHDYVLMIAKSIDNFVIGRLPRTEEANARYSNPDNDPRGVWMSSDISVKTYNAENDYPITTPSGRVVEPPAGRCWSLSAKAFAERLQDNRIWFGPDGDGTPRIKRFLTDLKHEGMAPTSIMFFKDVGHSQEGAQEVAKILDGGFFSGPKPQRLMKRLLTLANLKEDSIVLDFFSGSGSTGHAVMQFNIDNNSKRKFIMVQLPELCDEKSEAYKAGYKNICEIGKERIRRAGKQILELRLENLEKEGVIEKYARELSEIRSLEEVYGCGGTSVSASQETSKGRALCSVRSDETGGRIHSVKHSGRTVSREQGIYPVFENSKGLTGRAGNTIVDLCTLEILNNFGYRINFGTAGRNKQDALFPDEDPNTENLELLSSKLSVLNSDIGFRVLKVDDSNMKDVYYSASEYDQSNLDMFESNIKEDRNDLDLLFGCLLDWGLPLSLPYTSETMGKFTVHTYNDGDLVACFNEDVSEEVVKEIARKKPLRAVFRDSSFSNSASKINVFEIFKMISPETSVKVI